MSFTLELLHVADQEAGVAAIEDAPRLSAVANALKAQDIGDDGEPDNTLFLSSGDAFIPGLFFGASEAVFGTAGIADIQIQNELGIQAIALGNHEFDFGPGTLADLITGDAEGDILGADFAGADFPYLSGNLDFSSEPALAGLVVPDGAPAAANSVAASATIEVNGELIGIVGATTPTLGSISSPGGVGVSPAPFGANPTAAELDALAALIQADVDALLAANPGLDKVVLLSHMQRLSIETELAGRIQDVDIIVGGGSNTRLLDDNDRLRDGDSDQGQYPIFLTGADENPVALVNTDGSYKYLGRLVIEFDDNGVIIPESYDPTVSGAYATDAQGVADLNAEGLVDPEIQQIADAIEAQILATESNVFGVSDVFLNGNRSGVENAVGDEDGVRTQETNLGNLTADANLAIANEIIAADALGNDVLVSIKNGGGIRASIGQTIVPAGGTEAVRSPNEEIPGVKPAGGISQNDIETTLAFNNGLTLLTLTREELVAVLEHGLSALPDVAGSFAQVSGVQVSFDPDRPEGERIENAIIVDADGNEIDRLVDDGTFVGAPEATVRIVTLSFLAEPRFDDEGNFTSGGDGYPFPNTNADPAVGEVGDPEVIARVNRVDLAEDDAAPRTGEATFAPDGSEQDALAEFLADNFPDADNAFSEAESGRDGDTRLINLDFQADALDAAPVASEAITFSTFAEFAGEGGEGASEVVAHEDGELFVTNGAEDRIDVFSLDAPEAGLARSIDLAGLPDYGGVQSVDVKNGVVAVAIARDAVDTGTEVQSQPGFVALFSAATGALLSTVDVGNLPDQLTFSADGTMLFVAGEGEKNDDSDHDEDPLGTVAMIDVSDPAALSATLIDFSGVTAPEGVRQLDGTTLAEDLEPEYITVSPDGTTLFVALQENNALAKIDVATGAVTDLLPLGTVDFGSGPALDPLDDGEIGIRNVDGVKGFRMPDSIAAFEVGGTTYVATANEGDSRDFDEDRVGDLFEDGALDADFAAELIAKGLIDEDPDTDIGIERLEVSTVDGDTDGDGDLDELVTFSSRSFSIFDADGNLVFDSGDDFERILAEVAPERFNNDDGEPIADEDDNRSDAKGPEPEAIAVGEIGGKLYAFIGLERDSGIMIYDISDPANASYVNYIPPKFVGSTPDGEVAAHSPEIIEFIPAAESRRGEAQIAVSYEVSGTTIVYEVTNDILRGGTGDADTLVGDTGDDVLFGRAGDDRIEGGPGNDRLGGDDGDDSLFGGSGDDRGFGGDGDDEIRGNAGNDSLFGRDGEDEIRGGAGDDELNGNRGDDFLGGGGGDDRISGGFGDDTARGGTGDDTLKGNAGDDELNGGAGDDSLLGNAGADILNGNGGNDVLAGQGGEDLLSGGTGADTLLGNKGDDTLEGGRGDDVIDGGIGDDAVLFAGNFGDDQVERFGLGDNEIIITGADADDVTVEMTEDGVVITVDSATTAGTATLLGVETFSVDDITFI